MPSKCGTNAGWNVHMRAKEKPCGRCNEAKAVYQRAYRIRAGLTTSVPIPATVLCALLNGADVRAVLTLELGVDLVNAITSAPKAPGEAA